jgi:hypothetical protein
MRAMPLFALAVLSLAACSSKDDVPAPPKSATGADDYFQLPGVTIGRDDIDVDGVKVFPGSTVESVAASSGEALAGFKSPASVDAVKAYYSKQFAEKGVTVTANGDGFSGKTKDGDDFSLSIFAKDGVTTATMLVHDNKQ